MTMRIEWRDSTGHFVAERPKSPQSVAFWDGTVLAEVWFNDGWVTVAAPSLGVSEMVELHEREVQP